MPVTCPVCSKGLYSYQSRIECTSCQGWVHHDNRLKCSGLTDSEFDEHVKNQDKLYECDYCVGLKIAKENNSVFF